MTPSIVTARVTDMAGLAGRRRPLRRVMTATTTDALAEAVARYVARNPASEARAARAAAVLPGGNTRSVLHFDPFPLAFERGEGAHLWSLDGDRYTDFLGEFTAGLYGHSNPVILDAIREALASAASATAAPTTSSTSWPSCCARASPRWSSCASRTPAPRRT